MQRREIAWQRIRERTMAGAMFGRHNMETYRSGHNGADSKSVCRATGTRVRIPPSPHLKRPEPMCIVGAGFFSFGADEGVRKGPDVRKLSRRMYDFGIIVWRMSSGEQSLVSSRGLW